MTSKKDAIVKELLLPYMELDVHDTRVGHVMKLFYFDHMSQGKFLAAFTTLVIDSTKKVCPATASRISREAMHASLRKRVYAYNKLYKNIDRPANKTKLATLFDKVFNLTSNVPLLSSTVCETSPPAESAARDEALQLSPDVSLPMAPPQSVSPASCPMAASTTPTMVSELASPADSTASLPSAERNVIETPVRQSNPPAGTPSRPDVSPPHLRNDCPKCFHNRKYAISERKRNADYRTRVVDAEAAVACAFSAQDQALASQLTTEQELRTTEQQLKTTQDILDSKRKEAAKIRRQCTTLEKKSGMVVGNDRRAAKRKLQLPDIDPVPPPRKTRLVTIARSDLFAKDSLIASQDAELTELRNRVKDLDDRVRQLEYDAEMCDRTCETCSDGPIVTKTPVGTFNLPTRKTIYHSLVSGTPIAKTADLIKYTVKTMTGREVSDLPTAGHISKMTKELQSINNIVVGQKLLESKDATLAWDATTESADHFNELHVTFQDKAVMTLNIRTTAGSSADDYLEHTNHTFNCIASSLATLTDDFAHRLKTRLTDAISNTMSDRVNTNKKLHRLLQEQIGRDLLQLHCNLHPLDAMASQAREACKRYDATYETSSDVFGTNGRAANLLYGISKMR